jgi:pantoate--beta-alanine ligase
MKIFKTSNDLSSYLNELNAEVGFVPTMGGIHEGHLSLIKTSKQRNLYTVCSVFVNPNQFNDKKDLEKYPRTVEKDLELLNSAGCDVVFLPSVEEIYPSEDKRVFEFGNLGLVLEAKHRPGHFNGVAQVVTRLFDIVNPKIAFFGLKDFQQYSIIKKVVKEAKLNIVIEGCETVREADGLAMSTRNVNLTTEARKAATLIPQMLKKAKELYHKNVEIAEIKQEIERAFSKNNIYQLEYFEISDVENLNSINKKTEQQEVVACIAVFVGEVRLIDNLIF